MSKFTINPTAIQRVGLHSFGDGLYVSVTPSRTGEGLSRSYVFRSAVGGRPRKKGLGSCSKLTLGEARAIAADLQSIVEQGRDIGLAKSSPEIMRQSRMLFRDAAKIWEANNVARFKHENSASAWELMKSRFEATRLMDVDCEQLEHGHVVRTLAPQWLAAPTVADNMRRRINEIVGVAVAAKGRRADLPNPTDMQVLKHLLSGRPTRTVNHHKALPWRDVPAFWQDLLSRPEGSARYALQFTILTAVRSTEAYGAVWPEVDWKGERWVIPKGRMKAKHDFAVPLSPPAIGVLRVLHEVKRGPYIFQGDRKGQPLSPGAMGDLLLRMERHDCTPHGFRTSFRTWAQKNAPAGSRDEWVLAAKFALAHEQKDKTDGSYMRDKLFEERVPMMAQWGRFVTAPRLRIVGKVG